MRKGIVFLCAFMLVLGGAVSIVLAANYNAQWKGSLLVWPRIDAVMDYQYEILTDTILTIGNDGPANVNLKCYWMDSGPEQDFSDFQMELSKYKIYTFSAQFGGLDLGPTEAPPFSGETGKGMLACWAIDDSGRNAVSWNHLYGSAYVIDYAHNVAYNYNSLNFRSVSTPTLNTATNVIPLPAGPANGSEDYGLSLPLDGKVFDACPAYLIFNFLTEQIGPKPNGFPGFNQLTLVPCKQDLRQDHSVTKTKAKFDVWNNYETKLTNAWACPDCWWDSFLNNTDKPAYGGIHYAAAFGLSANKYPVSRFRVTGVKSSQCPGSVATGLMGLLVSYLPYDGNEAPFAFATTGNAPTAPVASSGFIYWDRSDPDVTRR
ncbi:MAG: hypothetical protein AAGU11_12480 [Syntrophobacteraceae bacterium]